MQSAYSAICIGSNIDIPNLRTHTPLILAVYVNQKHSHAQSYTLPVSPRKPPAPRTPTPPPSTSTNLPQWGLSEIDG